MNRSTVLRPFLVFVAPLCFAISAHADNVDNRRVADGDQAIVGQEGNAINRGGYLHRDERRAMNTNNHRDGMREDRRDAQQVLRDSADVYRAIATGPYGSVPDSVVSRANCIAVIPNVLTAAAVIGGTHGEGVASCKLSSGKWSQPAFVNINSGSLGAQLGAKSTDVVLYFQNQEAVSALKRGKFAFGADASVVAGKFERSFDTTGAGVVAYQRSSGAFLGAALNGGNLSSDEDDNRAVYGKNIRTADILEGREVAMNDMTNSFTTVLPR